MKKFILSLILIIPYTADIYPQERQWRGVTTETITENFSEAPRSSFSLYKSNFVIFGDRENQAKAQFSVQYKLFKESEIFIAYSQIMFWRVYDKSSPFTEINFNPELFWNYGNELNFIQLGFYEHKSNGRDGSLSRNWDRSYAEFQVSTGEILNAGIDVKGFYIWNEGDENKDIADYMGYYEAKIFLKLLKPGITKITEKQELYIRGGTGRSNYGLDFNKCWIEAGLQFRMKYLSLQPYLFIQGFYGYGESLIDYNLKDRAVRAGISF
jgi:phospholipase A1